MRVLAPSWPIAAQAVSWKQPGRHHQWVYAPRRALLSLPFVFSMDQDMLAALVRSPQVQAPLVVSARLPAQRRRRWQHLVVAAQAAAAIARRALRVVQLNSPCACSMGQAIQYARTSWPPVVAPWRACA